MPYPKQETEPLPAIERGVRFEVVTRTMTARGEYVPVTWTFANRAGAERLAKVARVVMEVVRRAVQADHGDSDAL